MRFTTRLLKKASQILLYCTISDEYPTLFRKYKEVEFWASEEAIEEDINEVLAERFGDLVGEDLWSCEYEPGVEEFKVYSMTSGVDVMYVRMIPIEELSDEEILERHRRNRSPQ